MKDAIVRVRIDAELKADPSIAQLQSLKRQAQARDHRIAYSADVSKGEMLLLKPEQVRGAKVRWRKASLV